MAICYVDIIDSCHLKCPTCVRGTRLLPNTAAKSTLDRFTETVVKAKTEGYDAVGLYNWTEPFLNPKLPEYVGIIKALGLSCETSTTLSFTKRETLIEEALRAGIDTLIVSVSGFTQEIHGINHRGGNLRYVKQNLEHISALKKAGKIRTRVTLRLIRFDYNADQEAPLADYANSLGLNFEVIQGVGDPQHPVSEYADENHFLDRLRHYSPERSYEKPGEVCPLVMDTVSINAAGKVFICCAYPNYPFLEIGDYLNMTKEEIMFKRYTHPICNSCSFPRRKASEDDLAALNLALRGFLGQSTMIRPATERPRPVAVPVKIPAKPPGAARNGRTLRDRFRDWVKTRSA